MTATDEKLAALRTAAAAYHQAERALQDAVDSGTHYNDPVAPYAVVTARRLAVASAALDYLAALTSEH